MTQLSNTPPAKILSRSPAIALLLKRVPQVATTHIPVLLLGETGVGKGLLARTIHDQSTRGAKDFHAVNCAALPPSLIESTLFGYEKGAFTGATKRRAGYFEQAHGSTLFLDEIGDMSLEAQQRLLHVLEQNRITRVGGTDSIPIDVRIMAATNRDLQRAIEEGTFRTDLYYRLNRFPLTVPPLRERREDIPMLAEHFVHQYAHEHQRPMRRLNDQVLAYLQGYAWPGNVRQLEYWVERAVVVCEGERMEMVDVWSAEDIGLVLPSSSAESEVVAEQDELPLTEGDDEKQRIITALRKTNWVVSGERGAMDLLGMSHKALRYRMRKYGIQRPKKSA